MQIDKQRFEAQNFAHSTVAGDAVHRNRRDFGE
jgi:hypothetical protein